MRETQTKEIDGFSYTVAHLAPMAALSLLADLTAVLGPALADLLKTSGSLGAAMDKDAAGLVNGIAEALGDEKRKEKALAIIKKMQATTTLSLDGKSAPLDRVFDTHFLSEDGVRLLSIMKWIAFAVGVQYGDFFKQLGSMAASLPGSPGKEAKA